MWELCMVFSPIFLVVEPQIQTQKAQSGEVFERFWNIPIYDKQVYVIICNMFSKYSII